MARKPRQPRKERGERKPREARAPRQIKGSGAVVFSFLRNTRANIDGATRHQLHRVSDGSSEIDLSRSHRNEVMLGTGNIRDDIAAYEKAIEIRGHARDSASPYLTLVLSASPEFFRPAGGPPGSEVDTEEDRARLDAWKKASLDWAKGAFGEDLVSAIYNGDETTPHIHLAAVPTYIRTLTARPRRLKDEEPEDHAARVAEWERTVERVRTRSWASNPVVGRNGSADLLRREYADAMAPMGLHYSLASYKPQEPDDPVSAREFRDIQKREAAAERERAEAERAEAEERLRQAREAQAAEDARRARFREEAERLVSERKAELMSERQTIADERARLEEQREDERRRLEEERAAIAREREAFVAERAALEAERDALKADGAVLEVVVSGLETGALTLEHAGRWTADNAATLKAAPVMWKRLAPIVRAIIKIKEEADSARSQALGLLGRVKAWLGRDDLPREARAEAARLVKPEKDRAPAPERSENYKRFARLAGLDGEAPAPAAAPAVDEDDGEAEKALSPYDLPSPPSSPW